MSIRQKVEDHAVVFFLGTLVLGFGAGLGTYKGILSAANLVAVPRYGLITDQVLDAKYISKDKHAEIVRSLQEQLNAARSNRKGESLVEKAKYDKVVKELNSARSESNYLQFYAFSVTRLMRPPSSWSIPEIGLKVSLLNSVPSKDGWSSTVVLGLTLPNEQERNVIANVGSKWTFSHEGTGFELTIIDAATLGGGTVLRLTKCQNVACK